MSDLESSAGLASLLFVQFQYELTGEKEDFRGLSASQIPHTVYGIRSAFFCCRGSILLFPIWNFQIGTSELLPRTVKCTDFEKQISLENFAFVAISGKIDKQTGAFLLRHDWNFSYNPEDFDSGE